MIYIYFSTNNPCIPSSLDGFLKNNVGTVSSNLWYILEDAQLMNRPMDRPRIDLAGLTSTFWVIHLYGRLDFSMVKELQKQWLVTSVGLLHMTLDLTIKTFSQGLNENIYFF